MAGNQDPLAAIGDKEYVDFLELSLSLARSAANTQTTSSTSGSRQVSARGNVTTVATPAAAATAQAPATSTGILRSRPRRMLSTSALDSATARLKSQILQTAASPTSPENGSASKTTDAEADDAPELPPRARDPTSGRQMSTLRRLNRKHRLSERDTSPSRQTWSGGEIKSRVAIATHRFVPVSEDDLEIKRDDVLEIIQDGHRWWYGRNTRTGKYGYVPSNHVKIEIPIGHEGGWKVETTLFSEGCHNTTSSAISRGRYLVKAVGDYEARSLDEIGCREGDIFVVLNDNSKWWYVRKIKSGKEGFIPKIYVENCDNYESENDCEALPETLGVEL